MAEAKIHSFVVAVIATLNTYEANHVVAALGVTVGAWALLFAYLYSSGLSSPRWRFGTSGQRTLLVWSWVWTSAAFAVLGGWWGFLAWRLSNGLIMVPTAPNEHAVTIFGYGALAFAALLLLGWIPRLAVRPPAEPPADSEAAPVPDDDPSYQPLYPDLSFEPTYQRGSYLQDTPEVVTRIEGEDTPEETVQRDRPRRRFGLVAAVAVVLLAIVGAAGWLAGPSAPAAVDEIASAGWTDRLARLFASGDGDLIADSASEFDSSGVAHDGDFAIDADRWRPLAEQGLANAQYKLGVMLANGRGVLRDLVEAHAWLNLAAAQGNEAARAGRDRIARRMTPQQIAEAQTRARERLARSSGMVLAGGVPDRIKKLSETDLVRVSQRLLNDHGFDVGAADGVPGPRTRAAIRAFERQGGLPETGEITDELVMRLEASTGSTGSKLGPTAAPPVPSALVPKITPASAAAPRWPAPLTACDRLAAYPSVGVAAGVSFARLDAEKAISACREAVAKYPDEVRFQFQLARSLHKAEHYDEAVALYRKAGAQGFAVAQRSIGFMYANGSGVARDPKQAASWLRQAADRCDADAQYALATLYAKGQGVPASEADAMHWYRLAAAQGNPEAREQLRTHAGLSAASAASGADRFTPADYTAQHFVDRLIARQDQDVVAAYRKPDYGALVAMLRERARAGSAAAQTLLGYLRHVGRGVDRDDGEAVAWYRKAVEQDDADARYLLGYMYQRGFGVPQYYAQALELFRKAADQGVVSARVNLGIMFEQAQGVAEDRDQAVAQYFSAAEAGLAGAQHLLAAAYDAGLGVPRDMAEALKWYQLAAAQGFALSQNRLGELYARGNGVPRDPDEAAKWFGLAADQGLPAAQFHVAESLAARRGGPADAGQALEHYIAAAEGGDAAAQLKVALAYLRGDGVARDARTAVQWLEKSAEQCNPDAQYRLAELYRLGQGVAKASTAEELKWLKLAAEQGQVKALRALSARYADGNGVEKNVAKALAATERAAAEGSAAAQLELAKLYAAGGEGVAQDYTKAAAWYARAAEQGNRDAQVALAKLYREGQGVARSYVAAVAWYRQAADQGEPSAQYSLGTAYRLGAGVDRDAGAAVMWYRRAAEQGNADAQRDLGLQYLRGEGVLQDYVQAHLWLGRAAKQGNAAAAEALESLAKKMTADQIAEADRLASAPSGQDG